MPDESNPRVRFIDGRTAPEIYADEVSGFAVINGTIAITLESGQFGHGPDDRSPARVVVLRLRMSGAGAQNLATKLTEFLRERGLDAPRGVPPMTVQ